MKKKTFIIGMMLAMTAISPVQAAEGWPANYSGVMLQGFSWDSYSASKWTVLTAQADELSASFNLIWVPQSGWTGSSYSMGYNDVYWYDQHSAFGSEAELKSMISTYKDKKVGIIADVVINHRNGASRWTDFPTEKNPYDGKTYSMGLSDICNTDEYNTDNNASTERTNYGKATGANDTGDDFNGCRDLDHTSSNVQTNIKAYTTYLLNYLGYAGFRYDMVKGYAPEYTKLYNENANPTYSVGEYWDGLYNIKNWILNTGKTSAAFDFPLKYKINAIFGATTPDWKSLGYGNLEGISTSELKRYAVTFVDNHDTYRNENKMANQQNELAANAFILALPGTPCIFQPHWLSYKSNLKKIIAARKAVGINNESVIAEQTPLTNGWAAKVNGTNGSVLLILGDAGNYDTTGYTLIDSGTNYAYYTSSSQATSNYKTLRIYVQASTAPYLYSWDSNGKVMVNSWPGTLMTQTIEYNGASWYYMDVPFYNSASSLNIIFNTGLGGKQTADIKGLTTNAFFTYDGATGFTDVTATGINAVKSSTTISDASVYSLNGQYMGNSTTGLKNGVYIMNKKKLVVR